MSVCAAPDCLRPAWANGLCHAHYKRLREGRPLVEPVRAYGESAWEALSRVAIEYANVSSEDDAAYRQACQRLRWAARRWYESDGKCGKSGPAQERPG